MAVERRTGEELKELVKQDRPMKVLVMGMPRSGTMSLAAALKILNFTPYDFLDRLFLGHMGLWTEALRAKFLGQGKPWSRPEFDHVVQGFDCVLDVPCPFFTEEFIDAYPSSLVILNKRDPDLWLASMNQTLFKVFQWPSWRFLQYLDPKFTGVWYTHCILTWKIFCDNDCGDKCRARYLQHYKRIKSTVPGHRLLEYEVQEGWGPLCEFLGLETPEEPFPNLNDTDFFIEGHTRLWIYSVFNAVKNLSISTISIGMVAGAWHIYSTRWRPQTCSII